MNDEDATDDLSDYRLNKAKEQAEAQLDGCMKFIAEAEAKRALFLAGTLALPKIE